MHHSDPISGHCTRCGLLLGNGRDLLPCRADALPEEVAPETDPGALSLPLDEAPESVPTEEMAWAEPTKSSKS